MGRPPLPIHEGKNESFLFWGNGPPWSERMIRSFRENNLPPLSISPQLDCEAWTNTMEEYYEAVRALASALLPVYAQALRMPSNFFQNSFNNPCWCIRLNYYAAPKEGAPPELGIPPHADGTFLDLITVM